MIRIRAAQNQDIEGVRELLSGEQLDCGCPEPDHFLVAENTDDRCLVGCGRLKPHTDALELSGIVVAGNHRGRGIGRRIVERLLASARDPVFLVTTYDGESYFRGFGFSLVTKDALPGSIADKLTTCQRQNETPFVALCRPAEPAARRGSRDLVNQR